MIQAMSLATMAPASGAFLPAADLPPRCQAFRDQLSAVRPWSSRQHLRKNFEVADGLMEVGVTKPDRLCLRQLFEALSPADLPAPVTVRC